MLAEKIELKSAFFEVLTNFYEYVGNSVQLSVELNIHYNLKTGEFLMKIPSRNFPFSNGQETRF